MVLSSMLSCVSTKLVECPDELPTPCWPDEETGDPAVESDNDGDCLIRAEAPLPLPSELPIPCDRAEVVEIGEDSREFAEPVTVLAREAELKLLAT